MFDCCAGDRVFDPSMYYRMMLLTGPFPSDLYVRATYL